MKNFSLLITLSLLCLSSLLSAQSQKHLWQLPSRPPIVQFNQNGEMSVFTYDRLSVFNVETGELKKSYDFLENRHPYIWPITEWVEFTEDFKIYHFLGQNKDLSGNRYVRLRFEAEKEKWEVVKRDKDINHHYTTMDVQGRSIVSHSYKESWLYKTNGKKLKKISINQINSLSGGRFGVFRDNGQLQLIDFSTDVTKNLDFQGAVKGAINRPNAYPEWYLFKEGENRTLFNPYTNEIEVKETSDPNKEIPSKYAACAGNFEDAIYHGNYIYQVKIDEDAMIAPDKNGAVPFIIEQYSASDCAYVKTFSISIPENENMAKDEAVGFIYDGVKLMDEKYKAESQARKDWDANYAKKLADKKEAAELSKELLINFKEAGNAFSFSLASLEARDISNNPYAKKYLTHLSGEIYAIAQMSTCATSKILLIAVRNGTATHFKLIKIHYEGAYRSTMDLASVDTFGEKLTQNLSITLVNKGISVRADLTKTFLSTGKLETRTLWAPCSGEWK